MNELALYNEIDDFAADWLENLIRADLIAPGIVDRRSIVDLTPDDVALYRQVHFFAGIGVWSYSLRGAGWPDDRPIWTGSCPCQPFSAAGKGGGFDDERHLWPAFFHLIEQCRPAIVLGEQVASKDGLAWLDLVQADMEGTGYAIGAVDTCSASVGAPHIRQRLRFAAVRMADAAVSGWREECEDTGRLAIGDRAEGNAAGFVPGRDAGGLADAAGSRCEPREGHRGLCASDRHQFAGPTNGFWRDADWLFCRDGKWRPVESGTFPLVDGAPSRVARLRAYGNAIVPQLAAQFILAADEAIGDCLT